jgi:cell division GTPase FtsZ
MKLVVIGFGQCGGRLADEFVRLNKRAKRQRGVSVVVDEFAINTDAADLAGLTEIKHDYRHRILIGAGRTHGHGVAKISELGAEIAREDADKVIEGMRSSQHFYDADAFLLLAGAAGGTGSGVTPVIARHLKERFAEKPVYGLAVLPFEHEDATEERAPYNTALCLKSLSAVADAVFLFDNQRYVRKDSSLKNNIVKINEMIVEPFYDILCAGEEKKAKNIGMRTMDAGDIAHTLTGWTAIGHGRTDMPRLRIPFERSGDYLEPGFGSQRGIQAMEEALSELSIACQPADAGRALLLLTAPAKETNIDLVKQLGDYLKTVAPEAVLRSGDYPRAKGHMDVTIVLSELGDVAKVREYYQRSVELSKEFEKRRQAREKQNPMEDAGKDIPSLL